MKFFDYDLSSDKAEYYETLQGLMERWEYLEAIAEEQS